MTAYYDQDRLDALDAQLALAKAAIAAEKWSDADFALAAAWMTIDGIRQRLPKHAADQASIPGLG